MRHQYAWFSRLRLMTGFAVTIALLGGMAACKHGDSDSSSRAPGAPVDVPMAYHPTNVPEGSLGIPSGGAKVYIAPVDDKRANTTEIGENTEETPNVSIHAAGGTPVDFVHDALTQELHKVGINITDSASGADRQINVTLSTFRSDEGGTYHGQILCIVKVTDASGKSLFSSSVSGENSTWGKSLSPENYQQVLSNSMVDLITNLLKDPTFVKALST
jgi:hypothetical protein